MTRGTARSDRYKTPHLYDSKRAAGNGQQEVARFEEKATHANPTQREKQATIASVKSKSADGTASGKVRGRSPIPRSKRQDVQMGRVIETLMRTARLARSASDRH